MPVKKSPNPPNILLIEVPIVLIAFKSAFMGVIKKLKAGINTAH
jgi:hypothetical protein